VGARARVAGSVVVRTVSACYGAGCLERGERGERPMGHPNGNAGRRLNDRAIDEVLE